MTISGSRPGVRGGGGTAVGIGGGGGSRKHPAAAGDREGDLGPRERVAVLVSHLDDEGLAQGRPGRAFLLISGRLVKGLGHRQPGGGEDQRLEPGHGGPDGVRLRRAAQGQGGGSAALGVGGVSGGREGPFAGGDREGDLGPRERVAVLVSDLDDEGLAQGRPGRAFLLISGRLVK